MVYSSRHIISLVPEWKTHPNPVMTQHSRERSRNHPHLKCEMGQGPWHHLQLCQNTKTVVYFPLSHQWRSIVSERPSGKNCITAGPFNNAGGYFRPDRQAWFAEIFRCHCHLQCQICFRLGDGQDTEGFSNIWVSLGCSHYFYTKVCSQMTSNGDLCHVGSSKLISETNRWTGPCMIQFLPEGRWEAMLSHWCESGKYTTVLCFGIGGGDSRVHAPFHTWGEEGFWSALCCAESLQDWGVFFILVRVKLRDVKKIPKHCNSLTLELVGWRLPIKRHETLSSKKVVFLYLKTYLFIAL